MDVSKKDYPRALPHRAPDAITAQAEQLRRSMEKLAAQSARLRRLTIYLLGGMALVVAVATAAVLIPMFGANGASAAVPEGPDTPATPTQSTKVNPPAISTGAAARQANEIACTGGETPGR